MTGLPASCYMLTLLYFYPYADRHTALTCADMVSWLSTITSRSRAVSTAVADDDRTVMSRTVTLLTSCSLITQRCPSYVADLVPFCSSDPRRRSLRSASTCAAVTRRTRTELGRRAFAVCSPDVWNSLPPSLRTITSHSAFHRLLKTHFYNLAFSS